MDFAERIRDLAVRIPAQIEHIKTEEATKNALVMPFINALGYNVFDPREVTPELVADVGTKRGEKVDYAILRDGQPIMLFECKPCNCSLDECHASQLYRYFSVTSVRIGILTNGLAYRFFSDLEAVNKMDSKPFFEVNMQNLDDGVIGELLKFSKPSFDLTRILATASDLKYLKEIKRIFTAELQQPTEEFVRFIAARAYPGRVTQTVLAQFTELTRRALQEVVSDRVKDRLKSALADEAQASVQTATAAAAVTEVSEEERVITSEVERDGYNIVRAIVTELVEPSRVTMRDQQSYCSVILDDSNRKPICRLWFNGARKYLGVFDEAKVETRVPIAAVAEIFKHSAELKAMVRRYLGPQAGPVASDPPQTDVQTA